MNKSIHEDIQMLVNFFEITNQANGQGVYWEAAQRVQTYLSTYSSEELL